MGPNCPPSFALFASATFLPFPLRYPRTPPLSCTVHSQLPLRWQMALDDWVFPPSWKVHHSSFSTSFDTLVADAAKWFKTVKKMPCSLLFSFSLSPPIYARARQFMSFLGIGVSEPRFSQPFCSPQDYMNIYRRLLIQVCVLFWSRHMLHLYTCHTVGQCVVGCNRALEVYAESQSSIYDKCLKIWFDNTHFNYYYFQNPLRLFSPSRSINNHIWTKM